MYGPVPNDPLTSTSSLKHKKSLRMPLFQYVHVIVFIFQCANDSQWHSIQLFLSLRSNRIEINHIYIVKESKFLVCSIRSWSVENYHIKKLSIQSQKQVNFMSLIFWVIWLFWDCIGNMQFQVSVFCLQTQKQKGTHWRSMSTPNSGNSAGRTTELNSR